MWVLVPVHYENKKGSDALNALVGAFDSPEAATAWLRARQYVGIVVGDELTFYFIPQGLSDIPEWMSMQYKLRKLFLSDIREAPS